MCARAFRVRYWAFWRLAKTTQASEKGSPSRFASVFRKGNGVAYVVRCECAPDLDATKGETVVDHPACLPPPSQPGNGTCKRDNAERIQTNSTY